jgi:hypothetical protein
MAKMNLGAPRPDAPGGAVECPWKLTAMVLVSVAAVALGFWLPGPAYELVRQTAGIIGGAP